MQDLQNAVEQYLQRIVLCHFLVCNVDSNSHYFFNLIEVASPIDIYLFKVRGKNVKMMWKILKISCEEDGPDNYLKKSSSQIFFRTFHIILTFFSLTLNKLLPTGKYHILSKGKADPCKLYSIVPCKSLATL